MTLVVPNETQIVLLNKVKTHLPENPTAQDELNDLLIRLRINIYAIKQNFYIKKRGL